MAGTFAGIELAGRAMRTNQRVIDVIGHNVANVNTPGYTRQAYEVVATDPYTLPSPAHPIGPLQVGTGVTLTSIYRVRDQFIDQQLRAAVGEQGQLNQMRDMLDRVQNVYGEPGESGLSSRLTAFFNAFKGLSLNAESGPVRAIVVEKARALAGQFNRVVSGLNEVKEEINGRLRSAVEQAHHLGKQIAALNGDIRKSLAMGDRPNDLEDRRDELVRQLADLVGGRPVVEVDSTGKLTGNVNIFVGAAALVLGDNVYSLPTDFTMISGVPHLTDGQDQTPVTEGAVAGLIRAADLVGGYVEDLNTIASTLIDRVNRQHQFGYGLDGNTGRPFFAGTDASNIAVDAAIEANLDFIAAATPPQPGEPVAPGNGDNARAIADIASARLLGNFTLGEWYGSRVAQIGADAQTFREKAINQEATVQQLQNLRGAVSGVSLDEELAHMLQYQRSYQASARLLSTIDGLIGYMIETIGR